MFDHFVRNDRRYKKTLALRNAGMTVIAIVTLIVVIFQYGWQLTKEIKLIVSHWVV